MKGTIYAVAGLFLALAGMLAAQDLDQRVVPIVPGAFI